MKRPVAIRTVAIRAVVIRAVAMQAVAVRAGHSDAYTASTSAVLRGSFAMWGPIRFIT